MGKLANAWRGIFSIAVTPFHDDGRLDEAGLASVTEFIAEAGAHGLVWPVLASEFYTLSDSERMRGARIVIEAAAGRLPVVIGCGGNSAPHAVELATDAAAAGADGIIAMPSSLARPDTAGVRALYEQVARAVEVPIMVQNASPPLGVPVSPALLAELAAAIPNIAYVKEEVIPGPHSVGKLAAAAGDVLTGIFGGAAAAYLFDEYTRGACGNMPACEFTDVHVRLWNLLDSGDEAGARTLFAALLPALNRERLLGVRWAKEVLRERGVITSIACRLPVPPEDAADERERRILLEDLAPHFTWQSTRVRE
jgi:dihydrodipicolinate synthase/N-acetylneuraminate lyase